MHISHAVRIGTYRHGIMRILSAVALSMMCAQTLTAPVAALSVAYFDDSSDAIGTGTTILVVGGTSYTHNAEVNVRAYFTANHGQVKINGMNFCEDDGWDLVQSGDPASTTNHKNGDRITKFTVGGSVKYGVWKTKAPGYSGGTCGEETMTFTNLPKEADTGLYYVDVSADPMSVRGYQNGFRVVLPSGPENPARKMIAQVGGTSGHQVTLQQQERGATGQNYRNYLFRFGTDCAETSDQTAAVSFYDLDNIKEGDDTVKPTDAQYGKVVRFQLVKDVPSGGQSKEVAVKPTKMTVNGVAQAIEYTDASKYIFRPTGASSQNTKIYFTAEPGAKYTAKLIDVYYNNTIQFSTPYDGVYHDISCQTVEKDWEVTGSTSGDQDMVPAGTTIDWEHRLFKAGTGTANITYKVKRSVTGEDGRYTDVTGATGTANTPPSTGRTKFVQKNTSYTTNLNDIGKEICEYIQWTPVSAGNSGEKHTNPYCVTVGINPSVHVLGNDVRVGSDRNSASNKLSSILASVSPFSASGGQYGVLAPDIITEFASDSGALKPAPMSTTTLTFANRVTGYPKCTSGCYTYSGTTSQNDFSKLSVLGSLPSIAAIPGVGTATPQRWQGVRVCDLGTTTNATLRQGEKLQCTDGDLTFQANNYTDSLVVKTTGRLTLAGDITYPESIQHDNSMPQLILSAQNIDITATVGRVDAWLVATDSVNTCKDISDMRALRLNDVCGKPLTVNGPIVANKLALRRTYFNTAKANDPAETLQLDGAAYVWAYQLGRKNGSWQTTSVTELPPRY